MSYIKPERKEVSITELHFKCSFMECGSMENYTLYFQRTENCQMIYGHGIDIIMQTIEEDCDKPQDGIKSLKDAMISAGGWFGKPLIMFDMSVQSFKYFCSSFKDESIYSSHQFTSTNGNQRVFVWVKINSL